MISEVQFVSIWIRFRTQGPGTAMGSRWGGEVWGTRDKTNLCFVIKGYGVEWHSKGKVGETRRGTAGKTW